ncbi:hypothetical protein acdb102_10430 [Acidothermaceae bacterium B102]|nr:hypothetical protein acdb102_10430 [Acidothermaceae bacterium B102]
MGRQHRGGAVITVSPQMSPYLREVEAMPYGVDTFEVIVRTDQSFKDVVAALQPVYDEWADEASADDAGYHELNGPAPSPWGHLFRVANSDHFDRSLSWVVALLTRAGVDGTLEPFRAPDRLWSDHDEHGNSPDQVVATIDLRADVSAGPGLLKLVTVEPERTVAIISWMTRWCLEGQTDIISRRIDTSACRYEVPAEIDDDAITSLLIRSSIPFRRFHAFAFGLHVVSATGFRSALISGYRGRLALTQGWSPDVSPGWPNPVAALTTALVELAPQVAYGQISRSRSPIDRHSGTTGFWPGRDGNTNDPRPGTDTDQLTDVFGVQLLGAGQAASLPALDATRWEVRTMEDCLMVSHREPSLWFSDVRPDAGELVQTRQEFESLLTPLPPVTPR